MGGVFALLLLVGSVVAWIVSGVNASKKGGPAGLKFFFINLGACFALIGLLYVFIVVPALDCSGFLCGLGAFLVFLLIGGLAFLIWPLILLAVIPAKFKGFDKNSRKEDSDLIDNL